MNTGDLGELASLIHFRVGAWQDLGYENPPDSKCDDCPHGRTAHLTRAPSRPEPYHCSACACRQYSGPHYAVIPPLGERSAKAIEAGHEAIGDIDELIAQLHRVREKLVGELRTDEDIRMARLLCPVCGHGAHPETPTECRWCPEGYCEAKR